ncbi:hypothetical protein [Acidithiobacillus ferriphilus]|jgi:hypothetical protein|uniref:hypothetical protein n=1 Tax=Acidithiobacillus ferriphilus TaxID=1689834 RepID=UPI002DBA82A5|nr:hypothetical protein [Acidithiobacillus ferriphilus]
MDHYKEAVAMEQEEKLLLTSEEAAAMLRKSAMAFRDSMCRGKAPWSRWLSARRVSLGRRYYCRRADVELVAQFGDAVVGLEQGENGHGRVLELEKYARRQSKRK